MRTKIINLTHWDLDGVASAIIVKGFMSDTIFDYESMPMGYNNLEDKILRRLNEQSGKFVVVATDLTFTADFIEQILNIENITHFIYLDHHPKTDLDLERIKAFQKQFKGKFFGRVDYERSGARLAYDYFSKNCPSALDEDELEAFDKLATYADAYDRWQLEDPNFKKGFLLNDIFWDISYDAFFAHFENGYTNDQEVKNMTIGVQAKRMEYFEETKKHYSIETIINNKRALIVLNPGGRFLNDFALGFPNFDIYILWRGLVTRGRFNEFSVRLKVKSMEGYDLFETIKRINKEDERISGGGHSHSGRVSVDVPDTREAVEILTEALEKELKVYKEK